MAAMAASLPTADTGIVTFASCDLIYDLACVLCASVVVASSGDRDDVKAEFWAYFDWDA